MDWYGEPEGCAMPGDVDANVRTSGYEEGLGLMWGRCRLWMGCLCVVVCVCVKWGGEWSYVL
jgi:hypothetical protein